MMLVVLAEIVVKSVVWDGVLVKMGGCLAGD